VLRDLTKEELRIVSLISSRLCEQIQKALGRLLRSSSRCRLVTVEPIRLWIVLNVLPIPTFHRPCQGPTRRRLLPGRGRPTFVAATLWETKSQVRNRDSKSKCGNVPGRLPCRPNSRDGPGRLSGHAPKIGSRHQEWFPNPRSSRGRNRVSDPT